MRVTRKIFTRGPQNVFNRFSGDTLFFLWFLLLFFFFVLVYFACLFFEIENICSDTHLTMRARVNDKKNDPVDFRKQDYFFLALVL